AGTLDEAFAWARDIAKLDFFAVTDHSNSFDTASKDDKAGTYNLGAYNSSNEKWQAGKNAAAAAARPDEFVSFYGYEMTWSGGPGHINTYATDGFVSRNNTELNNKTNNAGLRAYYDLLKMHPESISQFNHPGPTFGNFSGFDYYDPIIDQRITLLEIGNGEGAIGSGGYFPSYEQYDMALDKGWHLAPTNNQDNHKGLWGNSNTARTVVYTDDFTTEGIYQAMREMRVYATEDANLDIVYTLNGEPLGTVLSTVPDTAVFKVEAQNVAGNNKVKTISIITNGGTEVYKKSFGTKDATLDYSIEAPNAGYYYIKVIQEDGRIAVTAPVWLGKAEAVGISEVGCSTPSPVTTEGLTLTTEVFNNEDSDVTLNSVRYEIKGGGVIADNILNTTVGASSIVKHTQSFTPAEAKKTTIIITVTMTINETVKIFTNELVLNVRDIDRLEFIGIDASHLNEYVAGNYKDSMGNFSEIAMKYGLRTVYLNTSEEFIAAMTNPKFQMLIITAPTRRLDPATGITHKNYSQAELDAVSAFARQGKTVVVTGWGDYYESYDYVASGLENHMAGQQNKLLQAIGATLRLADDEAKDDDNNGGQPQRLYLEDYNGKVSPLLEGLLEGQKFSQYGGCTIYA
ncbi:MAG: DNA-binding protein, partial [Syntrophomonadaceae bacterium]|nr:DNA-binding protein [Syntrophomonadaceae bacterium]